MKVEETTAPDGSPLLKIGSQQLDPKCLFMRLTDGKVFIWMSDHNSYLVASHLGSVSNFGQEDMIKYWLDGHAVPEPVASLRGI